jgi:hypothetical protein
MTIRLREWKEGDDSSSFNSSALKVTSPHRHFVQMTVISLKTSGTENDLLIK